LPLRNRQLLGLRTLLLRITENKGEHQPIEKHFSASLQNGENSASELACILSPA
jgi:hypothetical protein